MKPLSEQINPKFVIQARKLDRYTQLLHRILPIECRNHVEVANIRNRNLMLITDSPVWATRLRQLSPQILQFIRENSADIATREKNAQVIHHVQIQTRYNTSRTPQPQQQRLSENKHRELKISRKTARLLSQSADSINDEKLKSALLRIARHAKD